MSVMDNLDIKAYKRILKMYEKNPAIDVWYEMASTMERPNSCCASFMMCCCYCLMKGMMMEYIEKRRRATEDLFMKKYPGLGVPELVANLKKALAVVEKHKMKLYNVRDRIQLLSVIYPALTEEDMKAINDAYYLLNPVVYII